MTNHLFPVFDVPAALAENVPQTNSFLPAPLWDYERGDFVTNGSRQPVYGSGFDAWVLWCTKTLLTQRWAHYAYSDNAGIEAKEAFAEPDRKAQESAFERAISEALLADPAGRTLQVLNFQFDWASDSLNVTCDVIGADGNSATITALLRE